MGVLFVHQDDVFFGLAGCGARECLENVEAGFGLSVYVISVWNERHTSVISQSE